MKILKALIILFISIICYSQQESSRVGNVRSIMDSSYYFILNASDPTNPEPNYNAPYDTPNEPNRPVYSEGQIGESLSGWGNSGSTNPFSYPIENGNPTTRVDTMLGVTAWVCYKFTLPIEKSGLYTLEYSGVYWSSNAAGNVTCEVITPGIRDTMRATFSQKNQQDVGFWRQIGNTFQINGGGPTCVRFINNQQPLELLRSDLLKVKNVSFTPVAKITFPDANLESAIRTALNKPTGDISGSNILLLTSLTIQNMNITNLSGLEYAANLTNLDLSNNSISDISYLSNLTRLTKLVMISNRISDITPISNLVSLTYLDFSYNNISNISRVTGLTNLTILSFLGNQLTDISSLSTLRNLTLLTFGSNQVSNISALSNLTNLNILNVQNNKVVDISPLSGLVKMERLYLDNNQIADISALKYLAGLSNLKIENNKLDDQDLVNLYPLKLLSNTLFSSVLDLRGNIGFTDAAIRALDSQLPLLDYAHILWNQITPVKVNFPDPNLEVAIRTALNKPTGDITNIDMLSLTTLASHQKNLSNISGLEYAKNLTILSLSSTQISDISVLSGLTNLTTLILSSTQISDISALSGLTNLTLLSIGYTPIRNITALTGLTNLTSLTVGGTQISDISALSGLTNLTTLSISSTQISDISALSGLTNLTTLSISSTQISDISSLSRLTNLTSLGLGYTQIRNISALSGLTNLTTLTLTSTQNSDISVLSGLKSLTTLNLSSTPISNISVLSGLNNLSSLTLSNTQISDITALSGLTNLTSLDLSNTKISNYSVLSGLTNLTYLYLKNNKLIDISAISGLVNLQALILDTNQIMDISPLLGLKKLRYLYLNNNRINDISPLSSLNSMTQLFLNNNQISDLSAISGLTKVYQLILSNNLISDENLPRLYTLKDLIGYGSTSVFDLRGNIGFSETAIRKLSEQLPHISYDKILYDLHYSVFYKTIDRISFDSITVNGYFDTSFVIKNKGNIALKVNQIYIDGPNASDFSIVSDLSPFSLDSNYENKITVRFKPLTLGPKYARIAIKSNDPQNPEVSINLNGVGINTSNKLPLIPFINIPSNFTFPSLNITLIWNKSNNASAYDLQVAKDSLFSNIIKEFTGLSDTSKSIENLENSTSYFWHVRSINTYGKSDWSSIGKFSISLSKTAEPTLLSPANNSVEQSVALNLYWSAVKNATVYILQLSKDTGFSSIIREYSVLNDTLKNITSLDYYTIYYWRVKAISQNIESEWSDRYMFTTLDRPPSSFTLMLPSNNGTVQITYPTKPVTFTWHKSVDPDPVDAVKYTIHVLITDMDFSKTNITDTSIALDIIGFLKPSNSYSWYVIASNGRKSVLSDSCSFKTSSAVTKVLDKNTIPVSYALYQNYPNPFNPSTRIEYSIPENAHVQIKIYDTYGREIETLVNEQQGLGVYSIDWKPDLLPSGVYYYKLQTGKYNEIKKMVYIR